MRNSVVIGFHAIEEALKAGTPGALLFLHRKSHKRNVQLERLAASAGISTTAAAIEELDRLSGGMNHRGAVLLLPDGNSSSHGLPVTSLNTFLDSIGSDSLPRLVLVLDGITDPHNLGAILRSADQFGVDLVIIPGRRSASVNPTVMKISSGAARYVPTAVVPNLVRALSLLKDAGFWVYGADKGGEPLSGAAFGDRCVIVLGAEDRGLGRLVTDTCDRLVSIPTVGHVDSLNVSVAAGVILYEIVRGRLQSRQR